MAEPEKPFQWTGRINAPSGGKPPEEEGWKRHLRSPVVLAGAVGSVLVVAGGLFSLTAVGVAGGDGGGGAIGELPGAADRRAFKVTGRQLFAGRRDDARQDRMNLEAIAAAEKRPGGGGLDGVIPEEVEDEPLPPPPGGTGAPGSGAGSTAKAGGGITSGGTASGGRGSGSSSFPKLAPAVNMQGMRGVSSNAGLRGLSSGRAILRRIGGRGASADGSGAGGAQAYGTSSGGGAAGSGAGGTGGGAGTGAYGAASEDGGEGASQNPGGGGGGGAGGELGPLPETPQQRIERLMSEAAALEKKADKEKQYAQIQSAGGHQGPAKYHYDRYKKYRAQAREKAGEAQGVIAELSSGVEAATSGTGGAGGGVEP